MQIAFTSAATRQWLGLSIDVRRRIDAMLAVFAETRHCGVKRLKRRAGARLRVGDWRVLFEVAGPTVIIHRVLHRREAYRQ